MVRHYCWLSWARIHDAATLCMVLYCCGGVAVIDGIPILLSVFPRLSEISRRYGWMSVTVKTWCFLLRALNSPWLDGQLVGRLGSPCGPL